MLGKEVREGRCVCVGEGDEGGEVCDKKRRNEKWERDEGEREVRKERYICRETFHHYSFIYANRWKRLLQN